MKNPRTTYNSVPNDIALKIASLLEAQDLCALGSSSRFWREQCGSDSVWSALCRERWPTLDLNGDSPPPETDPYLFQQHPNLLKWKGFYITKHKERWRTAISVIRFVERSVTSESIEGNDYQKAIQDMCIGQLGFKDVKLFFLKEDLHVLLNLAGLQHCISLGVQVESIMESLSSCKILERRACVEWWKSGGWLHRVPMQNKYFYRRVSLQDLAMAREEEVLEVLQQGASDGVLRFQISAAEFDGPPS